jgi:hypothetical protein
MSVRSAHWAAVLAAFLGALPANAEEMRVDEARRFIAGKQFSYTCFDGTTGNGRINADGSVAGYIQIGGAGPRRFVVLPANTLRVQGEQYCASLSGVPFQPCFNLNRTSRVSFRGSVSGLGFAYCDFRRRSARADLARPALRLHRQTAAASDGK